MATLDPKIIAKAWKDPAFKKKLLSDPKTAFAEMGIKIPEKVNVKVLEDTTMAYTFVLPASPTDAPKMNEKELLEIAAGCYCDTHTGATNFG